MKKSKLALLFSLLLFTVTTLTGCVDGKFHLTVNKDGSGDFTYRMLMDPALLAFSSEGEGASNDPLKEMLEDAKASGFTTTNINENGKIGYEAKKHIDNLQESIKKGSLFGDQDMDKNIKPGEGLTIEKGFLKTNYKLKMDFDMSDMTEGDSGESEEIKAMTQSMLRSMNFNFLLTLPVEASTHNASKTEDAGKTLVWNLIPGQNNPIEMEAEVVNTTNIGLIGGGAFLALVLLVLIIKRRKKDDSIVA